MSINKSIIALFVLVFTLFSCKNEEGTAVNNETPKESVEEFESFEVLFDEKNFDDPKAADLLKEINICSDTQTDEHGNIITPCSPELFKLFKLHKDKPLEDGFVLLVKAETGGIALRRVLVFERENGTLVKVNGFIANLIAMRKNKEGNDDLMLRFIDKIEGSDVFYNCIFKWENNKYEFKTVEVISEPAGNFVGRVKESVKDSVSKEIHQILLDNKMIF
jgi:uncharacterized lipoprotein NlpE involved in copper resistance